MMLSSSKQSSTCNQDHGFQKSGHNSKNAKQIKDHMFHVQIIDDPLIYRWNIIMQLKGIKGILLNSNQHALKILATSFYQPSKQTPRILSKWDLITAVSWMTY
jgi:hypothetical protein